MGSRRDSETGCVIQSSPLPQIRTIAKYAKPPYNEIVVNVPPAMLGPVAQESVVDSALLRPIFRPFKPASLYTSCTQIAVLYEGRESTTRPSSNRTMAAF